MKILIDTSEIKDQYSLYYYTNDLPYDEDFKYYATMAIASAVKEAEIDG